MERPCHATPRRFSLEWLSSPLDREKWFRQDVWGRKGFRQVRGKEKS
jgi:hypothetical protein